MNAKTAAQAAAREREDCREKRLATALLEYVRVERMFGHTGQHPDHECADCRRVRLSDAALSHGYLNHGCEHEATAAQLRAELAMSTDAANKGNLARQQAGGMEMEIQELRAELATTKEALEVAVRTLGNALQTKARNALKSSDASWYEGDRGHDWKQAVDELEAALEAWKAGVK